ncbi:MAG: molybdopterin-dependent oxidoreductase [Gemmatimonadaceae bacterium]|nr:molybdopterin-dependent oxidoreductase [Gemmatimonadaceae bacterium]
MNRLILALALALGAPSLGAQSLEPLTIRGPDGISRSLAPAELQSLPRVSGTAAAHNTTFTFDGHDLRDVLRLAGLTPVDSLRGAQLRRVVVFVGSDGYSALIALSDLDPSIGGRRVVVVDREDGKPLPPERAPRRIIVEGDHRPTRWVRQVVRIEIRDLPE